MKKTFTYIIIALLCGSLALHGKALASEVSGTLDTSGNASTNDGGTDGNTTPPGDGSGHSSEVGGELGAGGDSNTSGDPGIRIVGWVTNGNDIYHGSPTITAEVTGGGAPGISDEEAAHLALLTFGPRYGVTSTDFTPGVPDTGGSSLTTGSGSGPARTALKELAVNDQISPDIRHATIFVPRSGEGPVIPDEVAAAATAANASGLTLTQLILLALVGIAVLGSASYAISRGGETSRPA
jgi:hypothetical protein